MIDTLITALYAVIGIMMGLAAVESFRDSSNPARYGTGIFWTFMALIFAFGHFIPDLVTGIMIVVIGILAMFKQIKVGTIKSYDTDRSAKFATKLRGWVFVPFVVLAVVSVLVSQVFKLDGQAAIGIGSFVSFIVALIITKAPAKIVYHDAHRMVRAVGVAGVLPQLLATLGVVFTVAGVGDLTAKLAAGVFPAGNHFMGVALYCFSMAIFTIIMGNGFAAFAVITAAIGVPFVVAQGGNPAVVAAIGMTSGYCGTLLTPMAANFNSLPVALMEMKDNMGVIKQQAPIAVTMLVAQVFLMYFLAF